MELLESYPPNVSWPELRVSKAFYSAPVIALTAVIERRYKYHVLLQVKTPITASSDIIYVAVVSRRLL